MYVIRDFFHSPITIEPLSLTASLGRPLSRLLPPGLHFPIHALVLEQIRARYRRDLLLPVCEPPITLSTSKSLISILAG